MPTNCIVAISSSRMNDCSSVVTMVGHHRNQPERSKKKKIAAFALLGLNALKFIAGIIIVETVYSTVNHLG